EPDRWQPWTSVDGFHASGEDDRVYVVDLEAGVVKFGNGVRGRTPQIGQRIRATGYRYGGGAVGNVAAGAISKIDGPVTAKVQNPLAAAGGADGEAIADALERVPAELYVIPPTYRKVSVAVGVAVKPGFGVEAVRRWVELAIRQYLAPLPPFGPDGGGWPLGRRVHGPELEAAALQVEGVEFLQGLRVASLGPDGVTWVEGSVD